jgi:hypothetical protein
LVSKKTQLHLSSAHEEEDDPVSLMEVYTTLDIAREQRKAEARAMRNLASKRDLWQSGTRDLFWDKPAGFGTILDQWNAGGRVDGDSGKGGMEDDTGQSAST